MVKLAVGAVAVAAEARTTWKAGVGSPWILQMVMVVEQYSLEVVERQRSVRVHNKLALNKGMVPRIEVYEDESYEGEDEGEGE
jgi:hypothetical protein